MREFKFRAWCILDGIGSLIYFTLDDYNELNFDIFDSKPIVQQYTDLKDKNGKEIYVGDILLAGDFLYVVDFYEGCFTRPYIYQQTNGKAIHTVGRNINGPFQDYRRYEVIGNIYETPELIKLD